MLLVDPEPEDERVAENEDPRPRPIRAAADRHIARGVRRQRPTLGRVVAPHPTLPDAWLSDRRIVNVGDPEQRLGSHGQHSYANEVGANDAPGDLETAHRSAARLRQPCRLVRVPTVWGT